MIPSAWLFQMMLISPPAVRPCTKRVWSAGDSAILGIHKGQVVVTWPGARPQTFPNDYSHVLWQ